MGRGPHDLYTAWVPLGDIDLDLGGLLVLEGSHKKGEALSSYLSRDVDAYCSNRDDAVEYASGNKWWDGTLSENAIALRKSIGGRLLTAKRYGMGDALIFNMNLGHGSLDNRSDRIRLSTDTRKQLVAEPADARWIGEHPPGHRQGDEKRTRLLTRRGVRTVACLHGILQEAEGQQARLGNFG